MPPFTTENIEREPTRQLLTGLLSDAKELAAGHLGRLHAEVRDEVLALKTYILQATIAAGVVVVGAVLLGAALAHGGAALGLPLWAAYAIVAVIGFATSWFLVTRLRHSQEQRDLIPEQAIADLKHDLRRISTSH